MNQVNLYNIEFKKTKSNAERLMSCLINIGGSFTDSMELHGSILMRVRIPDGKELEFERSTNIRLNPLPKPQI